MAHLQPIAVRRSICGFEGNSDLYGLGVRVGLYLQLFSSISVSVYLAKESYLKFYRISNMAMLLSVMIIIINESVQKAVKGVEVNSLVFVLTVQVYAMVFPLFAAKPDWLYWTVFLGIGVVQNVYTLWFFFHGLDVLPRSACLDEYGFFFAKVSIWHWYRTVGKVFVCLGFAALLLAPLCMFVPIFHTTVLVSLI